MENSRGQRAEPEEIRCLLRHVRAARLGGRSSLVLPRRLAGYARRSPGVVATQLADAIRRLAVDPRGRDAAIRYYGLIRLPEQLQDIARELPGLGCRPVGLTRQQTRNLIRLVEVALADVLPMRPGVAGQEFAAPAEPRWPGDPLLRQQLLERVRASGSSGPAAGRLRRALSLYQADPHAGGADDEEFATLSRWQRYRLQRLAWAAVDACLPVSWQPAAGGWRPRPAPSAHGLLGPQVFVEITELGPDEAACLDDFLRHRQTDLDSLRLLLAAIYRFRARSTDVAWSLLGLLRQRLLERLKRHRDRETLALYAETLTVYVAITREREDAAGIVAARLVLGPLTAPKDFLRCHVAIDLSILQTAHGDFSGAMTTLTEQLRQVHRGPMPRADQLRWQRDLTQARSGVRLRQVQAGHGGPEAIADGIALVRTAQDFPLEADGGWLSSTFRRAAELLLAGAALAARAGESSTQRRMLTQAVGWMDQGHQFANTGSTDWQLQWELGAARLAELRGERAGFVTHMERAASFDTELRRFPGQALKLAQLQRRGRTRWQLDLAPPDNIPVTRPRLSPRAPFRRHQDGTVPPPLSDGRAPTAAFGQAVHELHTHVSDLRPSRVVRSTSGQLCPCLPW